MKNFLANYFTKQIPKPSLQTPEVAADRNWTWQLMFVVNTISITIWFPMGYILTAVNAPMYVIVLFIRDVQCDRFNNVTNTTAKHKWCMHGTQEDEATIMAGNPDLTSLWALTAGVVAIGAAVGVCTTGYLKHTFGMKNALYVINCIAIIGTFISALCVVGHSFAMFIVGRFILGVFHGQAAVITPIYISEISPTALRGTMGTFPMIWMNFGMLLSVIVGLPELLGTSVLWPVISWIRLLPAVLLFIALPFCPDSPRCLIAKDKDDTAGIEALRWLRDRQNVDKEYKDILEEEHAKKNDPVVRPWHLLMNRYQRHCLATCCLAMLAQQMTGFAAFTAVSNAILRGAGLGKMMALYGSVGVMALQFVSAIIGTITVDHAGRKLQMILGTTGCIIANVLIVIFISQTTNGACPKCGYGTLAFLLFFMVCYNIGPANVPFILPPEMFPSAARDAAMQIVNIFNFVPCLIISFLFAIVERSIHEHVYTIFAVLTTICIVCFAYLAVETKGKSYAGIQSALRKKYDEPSSDDLAMSKNEDQEQPVKSRTKGGVTLDNGTLL